VWERNRIERVIPQWDRDLPAQIKPVNVAHRAAEAEYAFDETPDGDDRRKGEERADAENGLQESYAVVAQIKPMHAEAAEQHAQRAGDPAIAPGITNP